MKAPALAIAALLAAPVPASATVWDFVETTLTSGPITNQYDVTPFVPGRIASTLTMTGDIDYTLTQNLAVDFGPPVISGNTDFSYWDGGTVYLPNTPTYNDQVYSADLQLSDAGGVLNGSISLSSINEGIVMTISNDLVIDAIGGSDGNLYQCPQGHCYISGYWVDPSPVSEPQSLWVLLAGLGLLATVGHRYRRGLGRHEIEMSRLP